MATTQIADVIVPEVFSPYTMEMSISTNALIQRGLIRLDPRLDALVAGGGKTINVPFTKSIARGQSKIGSDNPALSSLHLSLLLEIKLALVLSALKRGQTLT